MTTATNGATPAVAPASFGEAPASATVDSVSPSGRRWLITTRAATVSELMVRVEFLDAWLSDHAWTAGAGRAQGNAQAAQAQDEAAPLCDKCGQPMKRRTTKDGSRSFWSCSTRYGNGQWCQGKPQKDGLR